MDLLAWRWTVGSPVAKCELWCVDPRSKLWDLDLGSFLAPF